MIHAPWRATSLELQMAGVTLGSNYPLPIVMHDIEAVVDKESKIL